MQARGSSMQAPCCSAAQQRPGRSEPTRACRLPAASQPANAPEPTGDSPSRHLQAGHTEQCVIVEVWVFKDADTAQSWGPPVPSRDPLRTQCTAEPKPAAAAPGGTPLTLPAAADLGGAQHKSRGGDEDEEHEGLQGGGHGLGPALHGAAQHSGNRIATWVCWSWRTPLATTWAQRLPPGQVAGPAQAAPHTLPSQKTTLAALPMPAPVVNTPRCPSKGYPSPLLPQPPTNPHPPTATCAPA